MPKIIATSNNNGIEVDQQTIIAGAGGGEPDEYLKSASVSGGTLTLVDQDDDTITYSGTPGPQGPVGPQGPAGQDGASVETVSATIDSNVGTPSVTVDWNKTTGALAFDFKNLKGETGGGGGEPDAYLKSATVSGKTLTLKNKDNTDVVFDASYTLPTATTSALGGVKVDGTTVAIDANGIISSPCFYVGASAPANTNILWIDTTNGLKYYDGSAWVTVPVAYSA